MTLQEKLDAIRAVSLMYGIHDLDWSRQMRRDVLALVEALTWLINSIDASDDGEDLRSIRKHMHEKLLAILEETE